jgi:hypothetical protein
MQLKNAQYIGKVYCAKLSSITPTLSELIPLMNHICDIKAYKSTLYYTLAYIYVYYRIKAYQKSVLLHY